MPLLYRFYSLKGLTLNENPVYRRVLNDFRVRKAVRGLIRYPSGRDVSPDPVRYFFAGRLGLLPETPWVFGYIKARVASIWARSCVTGRFWAT